MKTIRPSEPQNPFSGNLRHYHRANTQPRKSWDDWVDGTSSAQVQGLRNWPKIIGIAVGVVALLGIITGLAIELS